MSVPLLELRAVSKHFGGLRAIDDLSFAIPEQSVYSLIGPNGAGKSTVFNVITGLYTPNSGSVWLGGEPLAGRQPRQIVAAGIARTFQNIRLFKNATAWENVAVAQNVRYPLRLLSTIFRTPAYRRQEAEILANTREWLRFTGLEAHWNTQACNLAYGQQRRLEIARALATGPRLLLLDEPAAGMNPQETESLIELINQIRARGISVLLIEHDMPLVMKISDQICVVNFGKKIAEGRPEEIRNHPAVIEAYLGADDASA